MDGLKNTKPKFLALWKQSFANRSGQVVIEYILLMVVMAGIGAFIVRSIVSRNADEPGLIVAKWNQILQVIANDNPED